jgi:aldose 1-epimerase
VRQSEPLEQLSLSRVSENGISIAVISARAGVISELLLNGVAVIPKFRLPNPEDFIFGSVLAPWPNRLADGQYQHGGRSYSFGNLDLQNNKSHGLLLDEQLEVRHHGQSELVLGYQFGSDPNYPFQIDLEIKYQLLETSLKVSATVSNRGNTAPFAIGFHPYLLTGDSFRLTAAFSKIVRNDERMLPHAIEEIAGLDLNQDSTELSTLDNCFYGADSVLLSGSAGSFEVRALENLPYFMLYRPKERFFQAGGAIAIEPMSAPANVFRADPDSVQLAEGETKQYSFEIRTL